MAFQQDRPQDVVVTFPIIDLKTYCKGKDPDGILDTLKTVTWDLINFPLTASRQIVTGQDSRGFVTIGHVVGFNPEDCTMTVSIFGKYEDLAREFQDVGSETVIYPRTVEGKHSPIIQSINIGDIQDFEYLTRPRRR